MHNAADSWWNPTHKPRPVNITYDITDTDMNTYKAFLAAAPHSRRVSSRDSHSASLVIDTSMYLANNASWAVAHLQALETLVGWNGVEAVEIGYDSPCNQCRVFGFQAGALSAAMNVIYSPKMASAGRNLPMQTTARSSRCMRPRSRRTRSVTPPLDASLVIPAC